MLTMIYNLIEQFFSRKETNPFPGTHVPENTPVFLQSGQLTQPVPVPEHFRGKPDFDYSSCIGCGMCERVCPARAIELYPVLEGEKKSKKIVIFLSRCTYCGECADICPKNAIRMSGDFMLAGFDRNDDSMIVGNIERREHEIHQPAGEAPD